MNSHVACKIEAKLKAATGRIFRWSRNVRLNGSIIRSGKEGFGFEKPAYLEFLDLSHALHVMVV